MKKTFLLSALTCGLLFTTTAVQAKTDTKAVVQHQLSANKKAFKKAPKEIREALKDSSMAIQSLQQKKIDLEKAKKLLSDATEKFDKALKDNPALDLIPLEEENIVYQNMTSVKAIEHSLSLAQEMLIHYDLKGAREVLASLRDEMVVMTTSIPMKVFPEVTKKAKEALDKKDVKKALDILVEGLDMIVKEEVVIPLPLLNAQALISEASKLDKSKKEEATKLLNEAGDELKKAKILGYTNSKASEYKALVDAIDSVKKEIKGKNIVEKMYDKLKTDFNALVHKSKTSKVNKAETKEANLSK